MSSSSVDYHLRLFELAYQKKWDEIIKILKKDPEINVNLSDSNNNYLIHYAILDNNLNAIQLMVRHNVMFDIWDPDGHSILFIPIKFNRYHVLLLLIKLSQPQIGIPIIHLPDKHDNIPLHYAIKFKNLKAIKILLQENSDINLQNYHGDTALHLSIRSREFEIFNQVIEKNPQLNLFNKNGFTPLHLAISFQLPNMCQILLEKGANPDLPSIEDESTSLIYTIHLNNIKLTQLILRFTQNINLQDYYGNTALHYCALDKNNPLIDIMIQTHQKNNLNLNLNLQNAKGELFFHIILLLVE